MTEESASSMELRGGGLSPSDEARVGVRGRPSDDGSMSSYRSGSCGAGRWMGEQEESDEHDKLVERRQQDVSRREGVTHSSASVGCDDDGSGRCRGRDAESCLNMESGGGMN